MRKYRDIGKTGVSFLTAFATGDGLDQDATGDGFLFNPGLYTNLLLPANEIKQPNVPITQININPFINPSIEVSPYNYVVSHFTIGNYSTNHNVNANENLGNTKYNYEVFKE